MRPIITLVATAILVATGGLLAAPPAHAAASTATATSFKGGKTTAVRPAKNGKVGSLVKQAKRGKVSAGAKLKPAARKHKPAKKK